MSIRERWFRLPQGARIGSLVAAGLVLLGGFVLGYASLAVANIVTTWGRSIGGELVGVVAGFASMIAFAVVVLAVPMVVGGCVGGVVERSLKRVRGSGA